MTSFLIIKKKLNAIVTDLFIRRTNLVFNSQSYFKVPNDDMINHIHYFISKLPDKIDQIMIIKNLNKFIKKKA